MTRTLFEIEISRGKNVSPLTLTRLANHEDDVRREFAREKITRITPLRTIVLGNIGIRS